jgi:hypothetical protein
VANDRTYTADQVAVAARELRQAAGSDADQFSAEQVIAMLGDEIRLLRERGFSDERIADLLSGFDIEVTADDIARPSPNS